MDAMAGTGGGLNMSNFDAQCLKALQDIATELKKIREIMEKNKTEENPSFSVLGGINGYQRTGKESR